MRPIVIAGIGTDVGKTLVSSIFVEALSADYWKPIQTGKKFDRNVVRSLVSNSSTKYHKELFHYAKACSPHVACHLENIQIPLTNKLLVIEGCGGVMTPLNKAKILSECFFPLNPLWILVSKNYLGSINHTLLSTSFLKTHSQVILGFVFTGIANKDTEEFLLNYTKLPLLFRLDLKKRLTKEKILCHAKQLKKIWPISGILTQTEKEKCQFYLPEEKDPTSLMRIMKNTSMPSHLGG